MNIFEAIEKNNLDKVKELLDSGIDVNSQNENEFAPLYIACIKGYIEIVELLLNHPNIDVNIQDNDGWTPLFTACFDKHIEIVKLLLQQPDINVNLKNKNGETPFHIASKFNSIEAVKLLLAHPNIDVNIQNKEAYTPLYYACDYTHIEIVKLLLARPDINVNLKDRNDETLLHVASKGNNIEIVKLLVTRPDIDVNIQDSEGDTPVMIAGGKSNYEIVKLLLTHPDIDISIKQYRKSINILHILCRNSPTPENLEVIKIILEKDDSLINSESDIGSPLYIAYESSKENDNNTSIIELLLKDKYIDVNQILPYHGISLLSVCCYDDARIKLVKLLLKHPNIDVKIKNNGETPLHICAEEGSIEIMKLLLSRSDIDINIKNDEEETPLKVACYGLNSEYLHIIKLLLSYPNIEIDFDYRNYIHDNIPLRQLFKNHKNNKLYKLTDVLASIEN